MGTTESSAPDGAPNPLLDPRSRDGLVYPHLFQLAGIIGGVKSNRVTGRYYTRCPNHDDSNGDRGHLEILIKDERVACATCAFEADKVGYVRAARPGFDSDAAAQEWIDSVNMPTEIID